MLKKTGSLLFLAFLLSAGIHFYVNLPSVIIQRIEGHITKLIQKDSAQITQWLKTGSLMDFPAEKFSDSPAGIKIYSNDSLIWWNNIAIHKTPETNGSITDTFESGSVKVLYNLKVWDSDGILNPELNQTFPARYTLKCCDGDALNPLNILNQNYRVSQVQSGLTDYPAALSFLFLTCLFVFTSFKAYDEFYKVIKLKDRFSYLWTYIGIISIGRLVFETPWLQEYFGGLAFCENWDSAISGFDSHKDIFLNLIYLSFLSAGLTSNPVKKKILSISPSLILFLSGLFIHGFLSLYVLICKSFAFETSVFAGNNFLLKSGFLNYVTIGVLILYLLVFFHLSQYIFNVFRLQNQSSKNKYFLLLAGLAAAAALGYWLFPGAYQVYLMIFTLAYILVVDAYTENASSKITYLLWWLILFSVFMTTVLYYYGIENEYREREKFVQNYYTPPDQNLITELKNTVDLLLESDLLQKFSVLEYPQRPDENEIRLITSRYIPSNKQVETIFCALFDKNGQSLFANHTSNFHRIQQTLESSQKISDFVYYNPFEKIYLLKFEIENEKHPYNPFLFITEIFPAETTLKEEKNTLHYSFDYLVFYKDQPVISVFRDGDRPDLTQSLQSENGSVSEGFKFFSANPAAEVKVVSFRKLYGLIKPISLFSFILTLAGFIVIALAAINTRLNFLPENITMRLGSKSSLKTKIQAAIILLIIASFIIIGVVTAFYFKNLFEVNQNNRQREDSAIIVRNMQTSIQNMADEESALPFLGQKIRDLAYVHNRDISLFDSSGRLIATTERINNLNILPFNVIQKFTGNNFTQSSLNCCREFDFNPLYFQDSKPFAFLGIRYLENEVSTGNIFDFISTILNVYIFLFLLAGAIAITISNSITQPLTILANKLKEFKLGKTHDPLEWKSNDEIGELINDYNNLTNELQRSAEIIARTERDMAWREMAKQVAHEIKNPLTPMKLSIQYLERAAKDRPEQAADLIPRVSATLVEQIDNLSQIANEFSNFATMPQASNEKIVLNEIVETIHDLFRKRDDMDISLMEPIDELVVFADKNHLIRILNNLVKNAIQAIPEDKRGKIEIELSQSGQNALIRVSDNGTGIPDHMKNKVFAPNFTTKSSGTGLGLAISANMIESFNGKIYFETQFGKGTDFYISIPLMRTELPKDGVQRVSLD